MERIADWVANNHRRTITDEVSESYLDKNTADLVFITNDGASLFAHRSLFAGISPFLDDLFTASECCKCQGKNCSIKKEPTVVHWNESYRSQTLRDLLKIIYTGRVDLPKTRAKDLAHILSDLKINIKLDIMPLNPGQQPPPPIPAHVPPPPPPVIAQPVPVIQAASLPLSQSPAQMLQASRAFNPHAPRAAADNSSAAAAKPSTSEAALALMAAKNLQEASSSKSMSVPGHSVKRSKLRGPASARAKRARLSSSDSVDEPGKDTKETQDKHSEQSSSSPKESTPIAVNKNTIVAKQVEMAKMFKEKNNESAIRCIIPGCNATIVYKELSPHFKTHFFQAQNNKNNKSQNTFKPAIEPTKIATPQPQTTKPKSEECLSTKNDIVERKDSSPVDNHTNNDSNKFNVRKLVGMDISDSDDDNPDEPASIDAADNPDKHFMDAADNPDEPSSLNAADNLRNEISSESDDEPDQKINVKPKRRKFKTKRKKCHLCGVECSASNFARHLEACEREQHNLGRKKSRSGSRKSRSGSRKSRSESRKSRSGSRSSRSVSRSRSRSRSRSASRTSTRSTSSTQQGNRKETRSSARNHSPSLSKESGIVPPMKISVKDANGDKESPPKKVISRSKPSVHKLSAEQLKDAGIVDTDKSYWCQICSHGFRSFRKLRTHYTMDHFWDKLKAELKDVLKDNSKCHICRKEFPDQDYLIQHMGNFHNYNDKFLKEQNLIILNEERTVQVLNRTCKICFREIPSSSVVKGHMAVHHFFAPLKREFNLMNSNGSVVKNCPKVECSKNFQQLALSNIISHIGSFHDEVLKYAAEYLDLSEEDMMYVPVDDFDDGVEGIPYQDPSELEGKKDLFDCAKCGLKYDQKDLRLHYLEQHYMSHFCREYTGTTCCACDATFKEGQALHRHMVITHEQFLASFLEKDGIELPNENSSPTHSVVKKRSTKSKPMEYFEEAFNLLFCQLCNQETKNAATLKCHYVTHLLDDRDDKLTVTQTCMFCSMKYSNTSDNSDHMALNHTELFLIPYMKEKNLWINAPVKELDTERYPVKKLRIDVKIQKLKSLNNDEIVRKSGPASRRRLAAAGMPSPRSPLRSRTSSLAVATPNSEPSKSKNDVKTSFVNNPLFHSQDTEGKCPECEYDNELGGTEALKLHLIRIHYHEEFKAKYSTEYSNDKNTCPVCNKTVCNFGILTKYLSHLVSEHNTIQDILDLKKSSESQDSSNQEKTEETAKPSNKPSRKKQIASKSGGGRLKVRSPLTINSDVKEDYL